MVHGDPGSDIFAMDVARYGDWATMAYTNTKVKRTTSAVSGSAIRTKNYRLPARTAPLPFMIC
ncbi:hypothetical protein [Aliamphritea spongicola]|nr:hypothetical protein [Aliamphritea spongicola]